MLVINERLLLRTWIDQYVCCIKFEWNHRQLIQERPYRQTAALNNKSWIARRMQQNAILILQTLAGSLPQLILQLAAILYYQDINDILLSTSVFSSILSLSLITVMILNRAYIDRIKTTIYICLCIIMDAICFILMICFIFYVPTQSTFQPYFSTV